MSSGPQEIELRLGSGTKSPPDNNSSQSLPKRPPSLSHIQANVANVDAIRSEPAHKAQNPSSSQSRRWWLNPSLQKDLEHKFNKAGKTFQSQQSGMPLNAFGIVAGAFGAEGLVESSHDDTPRFMDIETQLLALFHSEQFPKPDSILSLFTSPEEAISWRSQTQGSLILFTMLHGKRDAILEILRLEFVGELLQVPYGPGLYAGETPLHVACAEGDVEMVMALLQRAHKNLQFASNAIFSPVDIQVNALADGIFFCDPAQPGYGLGCTPYSFAAGGSHIDIMDELVKYGADVNKPDHNGNTALHMLVIAGTTLYDNTASEFARWRETYMTMVRHGALEHGIINKDGRTPFTLGLQLLPTTFAKFLVDRQDQIMWKWGPLHCSGITLAEMDTYPLNWRQYFAKSAPDCVPKGNYFFESGLHIIQKNKRHDLVDHPFVRNLIDMKWGSFGRVYIMRNFAVDFALLVLLAIMVAVRPAGPDQIHGFDDPSAVLRYTFEFLTVSVAMFQLGRKGIYWWGRFRSHEGQRALSIIAGIPAIQLFFFAIEATHLVCIVLACIFRIRHSGKEETMLAIASITGWAFVLSYLRPFYRFGVFVVLIFEIITKDMVRFLVVGSCFLVGFAQANFILTRSSTDPELANRMHDWHLLQLFQALIGEVGELPDMRDARRETTSHAQALTVIYAAYIVIMSIGLMNILIAMLTQSYDEVFKAARGRVGMLRLAIVLDIEHTFDNRQARKYRIGEKPPKTPSKAQKADLASVAATPQVSTSGAYRSLTTTPTASSLLPLTSSGTNGGSSLSGGNGKTKPGASKNAAATDTTATTTTTTNAATTNATVLSGVPGSPEEDVELDVRFLMSIQSQKQHNAEREDEGSKQATTDAVLNSLTELVVDMKEELLDQGAQLNHLLHSQTDRDGNGDDDSCMREPSGFMDFGDTLGQTPFGENAAEVASLRARAARVDITRRRMLRRCGSGARSNKAAHNAATPSGKQQHQQHQRQAYWPAPANEHGSGQSDDDYSSRRSDNSRRTSPTWADAEKRAHGLQTFSGPKVDLGDLRLPLNFRPPSHTTQVILPEGITIEQDNHAYVGKQRRMITQLDTFPESDPSIAYHDPSLQLPPLRENDFGDNRHGNGGNIGRTPYTFEAKQPVGIFATAPKFDRLAPMSEMDVESKPQEAPPMPLFGILDSLPVHATAAAAADSPSSGPSVAPHQQAIFQQPASHDSGLGPSRRQLGREGSQQIITGSLPVRNPLPTHTQSDCSLPASAADRKFERLGSKEAFLSSEIESPEVDSNKIKTPCGPATSLAPGHAAERIEVHHDDDDGDDSDDDDDDDDGDGGDISVFSASGPIARHSRHNGRRMTMQLAGNDSLPVSGNDSLPASPLCAALTNSGHSGHRVLPAAAKSSEQWV